MRIVVTGASGNLGTALLRRLTADGVHDVVGLVRRPPEGGDPYDQVAWTSLDLTAPDAATGLEAAFRGADAVVHLAWGFQPARDVAYLERLGVGGTAKALAAARAADVGHLVHVSSVGAYSPSPGRRVDESWPVAPTPTSPYSRHKVAAEGLLDEHEAAGGQPLVTRLRPGFVLQHDAGSALLRYGMPSWLPTSAIGLVPVVPLDRRLRIPVVHADDVADAAVRVLGQRAAGAFNLAAEPAVTAQDFAGALHAPHLHVPAAALGAVLRAAWAAHVQPLDPSWLDLAFSVPLLDTTRARDELGWAPATDAVAALRQAVEGMRAGAGTTSAVLRPRALSSELATVLARGATSRRRRP